MQHGSVDIPDVLLEAQLSGKLVVFAGAGISRSAPSNLPDFEGLVGEIELESGVERRGSGSPDERPEEPDVYLGRVAARPFPVHRYVAERFAAAAGEPNTVHRAVIDLFREANSVRIVTTNFDQHLSTAAGARWSEGVPQWAAPALPLGDEFSGLVYVHGAVGEPPENLVVTDADFGEAYLTRGYARRFLLDCFRYVVLFVGYSFGDRVVSYLVRGLPVQRGAPERFAFVDAAEQENWRQLGIEPIAYDPRADPSEPHAQLRESLERWAHYTQMGFSAHAARIREIVRLGPDGVDPESQDYLRRRIRDPETVDFFCREASDPKWLSWLEGEQVFRNVFLSDSTEATAGASLARWFAGQATSAPDQARATIARLGNRISTSLWIDIVGSLRRARPSPEILAGWLPILMGRAPHLQVDFLSFLLKDSRPGEDDDAARLLFAFLTEPSAVMRSYPRLGEGKRSTHRNRDITGSRVRSARQKLATCRRFVQRTDDVPTGHARMWARLRREMDEVGVGTQRIAEASISACSSLSIHGEDMHEVACLRGTQGQQEHPVRGPEKSCGTRWSRGPRSQNSFSALQSGQSKSASRSSKGVPRAMSLSGSPNCGKQTLTG